jgi:hypothetical protein
MTLYVDKEKKKEKKSPTIISHGSLYIEALKY